MNLSDVIVLVLAVAAGLGGWRFGFVTRVLAWCGVALGLLIGIHFVLRVVTSFGGTNADDRVTVAILFLLLVVTLGQTAGFGVSLLVHRPARARPLATWDRTLGATLGVTGTLLLVWLLMPSMSAAPGWPARVARGSALVRIADHAPAPPDRFEAIGRSIRDAPYPTVQADPRAHDPGRPSSGGLSAAQDARVRKSVVRVSGIACNDEVSGSGWVFANEYVMTAAHVVAGEHHPTVATANGLPYPATVVVFDPLLDFAVLHVADFPAPSLAAGPETAHDVGASYGFPYGGPLTDVLTKFGIRTHLLVNDIYNMGHHDRVVIPIHAVIEHGDSGGPVVDRNGRVVGMVFAAADEPFQVGWTTAVDELLRPMQDAHSSQAAVGTGPCLYSADAPERGHKRSNTG